MSNETKQHGNESNSSETRRNVFTEAEEEMLRRTKEEYERGNWLGSIAATPFERMPPDKEAMVDFFTKLNEGYKPALCKGRGPTHLMWELKVK